MSLAVSPNERTNVRNTGVVYTPAPLAAFVVDRLVGSRPFRWHARWLDPACGDGAFLIEIISRMAADVSIEELPKAVEERVYGIDVDPTACRAARNAVVRAVEQRCGPQGDGFFGGNIRVADFLELAPKPGGHADLIVGNPPYVSATDLTAPEKERYLSRFGTAWGRLDLYALFIEQGLKLLADGGSLAYITPDKWLTSQSSRKLRSYVSQGFALRSVDRFDRHDLFPRVATVPCVTVIDRPLGDDPPSAATSYGWWDVDRNGKPRPVSRASLIEARADGSAWTPTARSKPTSRRHLGRLDHVTLIPLKDLVTRISVGVATGLNRCFVLDEEQASTVESELLRPVARGRDIYTGTVAESQRLMLVPYRFPADGSGPKLIDLDHYPGAQKHLEHHRKALERRHCVRVWGKSWYDLHDPVTADLASQPKILAPDIALTPRFALDSGRLMPCHSAYYLLLRPDAPLTGLELVNLLNEAGVAKELRRCAPTAKSGYRRFRAQVLRELVLPVDLAGNAERDAA